VATKTDSLDYAQFYQTHLPKTTKNVAKFYTNPETKLNNFASTKQEIGLKTLQETDITR